MASLDPRAGDRTAAALIADTGAAGRHAPRGWVVRWLSTVTAIGGILGVVVAVAKTLATFVQHRLGVFPSGYEYAPPVDLMIAVALILGLALAALLLGAIFAGVAALLPGGRERITVATAWFDHHLERRHALTPRRRR